MSSKDQIVFTRDNIDTYLKALAKEYRKLGGKSFPAEIVLIGGASVLVNYGFRDMTTDIDAVIQSATTMKEAINHVGDELGLPRGWLNEDFKMTSSYTPKLTQYSVHYKTFYGILDVRTVSGEYLIAMKLKSGRQYKNDLSDILGILASHDKAEKPITRGMIDGAVRELYGSWDDIPDVAKTFLSNALADGDYSRLIAEIRESEKETKSALLEFQDKYPGKTTTKNVDDILDTLKKRKKKEESER